MALKWELETLDGLQPETAQLYRLDPERNTYRLDVAEPDAVTRALRAEREGRTNAERIARAAETALAQSGDARAQLTETQQQRDAALAAASVARSSLLALSVQQAAQAAGLHSAAIPDAIRAARDTFTVGDDGTVKPKAGAVPLADWLAAQRDESPHWFPATGSGSGAQQSRSQGNSQPTMKRSQFEALPPAQRAAVVRDNIVIKD
jgi:hypothetical protein